MADSDLCKPQPLTTPEEHEQDPRDDSGTLTDTLSDKNLKGLTEQVTHFFGGF